MKILPQFTKTARSSASPFHKNCNFEYSSFTMNFKEINNDKVYYIDKIQPI